MLNGCVFDEAAGLRVVKFIERFCHHSKGRWAGKPFILEPWQKDDILMPLFGWMNTEGFRRYRIAYAEVPKKNGKSTMCSGIALYMLIGDREAGPEIYGAAFDRQQAGIIWSEADNMRRQSPGLRKILRSIPSQKRITYPGNNGFYQALSRETMSAEGINPSCTLFDEVHVQKTRVMWDTLRYGGAARTQSLLP